MPAPKQQTTLPALWARRAAPAEARAPVPSPDSAAPVSATPHSSAAAAAEPATAEQVPAAEPNPYTLSAAEMPPATQTPLTHTDPYLNHQDPSTATPAVAAAPAEAVPWRPGAAQPSPHHRPSTNGSMPAALDSEHLSTADPTAPLVSDVSALPLPPGTSIVPLTPATMAGFRRLITTLLPVRYPDKTYAAILANADGTIFCRVAVWRPGASSIGASAGCDDDGILIGAVCARVQDREDADGAAEQQQQSSQQDQHGQQGQHGQQPGAGTASTAISTTAAIATDGHRGSNGTGGTGDQELYVQMLGVLSPHRGRGLATALLETVVGEAARACGVRRVSAHVWQANDDALGWYRRRGFAVEGGLVQEYYRKLRPHGAWVVGRAVRGVEDGSADEDEDGEGFGG